MRSFFRRAGLSIGLIKITESLAPKTLHYPSCHCLNHHPNNHLSWRRAFSCSHLCCCGVLIPLGKLLICREKNGRAVRSFLMCPHKLKSAPASFLRSWLRVANNSAASIS